MALVYGNGDDDDDDYDDNSVDENDDDDDDDDERVVECGSGLDKEHLLEATQGWRPTIRATPLLSLSKVAALPLTVLCCCSA